MLFGLLVVVCSFVVIVLFVCSCCVLRVVRKCVPLLFDFVLLCLFPRCIDSFFYVCRCECSYVFVFCCCLFVASCLLFLCCLIVLSIVFVAVCF